MVMSTYELVMPSVMHLYLCSHFLFKPTLCLVVLRLVYQILGLLDLLVLEPFQDM